MCKVNVNECHHKSIYRNESTIDNNTVIKVHIKNKKQKEQHWGRPNNRNIWAESSQGRNQLIDPMEFIILYIPSGSYNSFFV